MNITAYRASAAIFCCAGVTAATAVENPAWHCLEFGNGVFVGQGDRGVYSSTDGTTWALTLPDLRQTLRYLHGVFIATQESPAKLFTSLDGNTWTQRNVPVSYYDGVGCIDVGYGNGIYVATGVTECFTSTDAITWTRHAAAPLHWAGAVPLAYGGGKFVTAAGPGHIVVSSDGIAWKDVSVPTTKTFVGFTFGTAGWVALASEGLIITSGEIWRSSDGESWTKSDSPLPAFPNSGMFYSLPKFVAGRYYIPCYHGLLSSEDGDTFKICAEDKTELPANYTTVTAGGGIIFASGLANANSPRLPYLASADGVNWSTKPLDALSVVSQPQSQIINLGSSVVFTVTASRNGAGYQWLKDDIALVGKTDSTLFVSKAAIGDSGEYRARITFGNTATDSAPSDLRVRSDFNSAAAGRLVNLSVRSAVGAGSDTLIVGFVIAGGSQAMPVLLRGVGPGLAQFSVQQPVSDPAIELFVSGHSFAQNNDWTNSPDFIAAENQVGAFPLTVGSTDAGALLPLPSRLYSLQVNDRSGEAGVALAELYDATKIGARTADSARLINVSARTHVGTGDDILIAGFSIVGDTPRTVLVRGVGPGLAAFGVDGILVDPNLTIYSDNTVVASNDDWGGSAQLSQVAESVGAFGLAPQSKDAALLVTLQPGSYSVAVRGGATTTGVGLVEVYEVQ